MTKKTKEELIRKAWSEYDKKRKPFRDEYYKKEKPLWNEYKKKKKEIEEKFKGVCEVCGK